MTSRTIIGLAVVATALLAVGAQLLGAGSALSAVVGALLLVLGMAAAAAAVAGAWRPAGQSSPGSDPGPTESASHSSRGRMARQSARTEVSAARVPQSADGA